MGRPAAIFDLDGTLLAGTSAEKLFLRRAFRDGTVSGAAFARGLGFLFAWTLSGRAGLYAASKAYLRGLACPPVERSGVTCVDIDVRPRLRPAMLAALATHREREDRIVILSGTLDFLGMEVARLVGADAFACTVLERRDGVFTGRVVPPYPHGEGKVEALRALASREDLDLALSHAYANHASDAAHLSVVGTAHAVAPDRGLEAVARARGWSIHVDGDDEHGRAAP